MKFLSQTHFEDHQVSQHLKVNTIVIGQTKHQLRDEKYKFPICVVALGDFIGFGIRVVV